MKHCTESTITNISQYLSAVRERGHVQLYRGQAEDWPLVPSIGRVNVTVLDGLLEIEENIVKQLKRYGYPYFRNDISNETDWLLHAQHFGLPTRLLDFTQNSLKALYFAVEDTKSEKDGVVWGLDDFHDAEPPSLSKLTKVKFYTPSHINNRITAQESAFAVFPLRRNDLEIIPLEKQHQHHRFFLKIIIPSNAKKEIKEELGFLGINKMSIYPGIDGVVEKIKEECGLNSWKSSGNRLLCAP